MSITLLHLADVHLAAPLAWMGPAAADRRQDLNHTFARAIDHAVEQVDLVVLAGDIMDTHRPTDELVSFFRNQIHRLQTAGIPAVLVPGNHDAYYYPDSVWRAQDFPGLTTITFPSIEEPVTLDIKGTPVHIYGMAYQPTLSKGPFDTFKKTDQPGIHIALIHGSLMHSPEWGVRSKDIPLDPKKLANSGMDYIALGHYHQFTHINTGGTHLVYPGSLEGLNLQDLGDRYLVTVTFDEGNVTIDKMAFQTRTIHQVDIDLTGWDESGTEQVLKHLRNKLTIPEDIYSAALKGTASDIIHAECIQEELQAQCFFLTLQDQTYLLEAETIERIAAEPSIRGGFVRAVRQRLEDDPTQDRDIVEMALRFGLEKFIDEV
jgi:exonuclease SbcD